MTTRAAIAVIFLLAAEAPSASQAPNWSGTWASRPTEDVEVLRLTPGTGSARGWSPFVEALSRRVEYRIAITQSNDQVVVEFPGGTANMLTVPGFSMGDVPTSHIVDRGEWWTNSRTMARWAGTSLELTATTFTGWWRSSSPEQAQPRPTDFRIRFVLAPGLTPDELVLRATLTDEKGEVEYQQRFWRVH